MGVTGVTKYESLFFETLQQINFFELELELELEFEFVLPYY